MRNLESFGGDMIAFFFCFAGCMICTDLFILPPHLPIVVSEYRLLHPFFLFHFACFSFKLSIRSGCFCSFFFLFSYHFAFIDNNIEGVGNIMAGWLGTSLVGKHPSIFCLLFLCIWPGWGFFPLLCVLLILLRL
jgi:hypothetical protein